MKLKRIIAVAGIAACLGVRLVSASQAREPKVTDVLFSGTVVPAEIQALGQEPTAQAAVPGSSAGTPGEMISLIVVDKTKVGPGSEDQFQVEMEQAGSRHVAPVRNVIISSVAMGDASLVAGHLVTFTVPRGLTEGEAAVIVLYRGGEIARFNFVISARPSPPSIVAENETLGRKEGPLRRAEAPASNDSPNLKLERGGVATLPLYPLVDPHDPDSAIFVTFKQESFSREIKARVVYRGETTRSKSWSEPNRYQSTTTIETARFEARVDVPADLATGTAQIDVRTRSNREISEARSVNATVVNPGATAVPATPRIVSLTRDRIGVGQATTVVISDLNSLGPDPSKVLIVLEQGQNRIGLRPEMAPPLLRGSKAIARETVSVPAELKVRVSNEMTSMATLRVFNPALAMHPDLATECRLKSRTTSCRPNFWR